jgi:SAM-dependent MidA family methyltransferase
MADDCRAVIADRIRRTGPLTVAEYIDLALYAPGVGYYARAAQASGRAGDFITSVDVGPLFGDLLGRQFAEMAGLLAEAPARLPPQFDLVEAAAGNGRLSKDVLDAVARHDSELYSRIALHLVERSEAARAAQAATLGGHTGRLVSSGPELPPAVHGVIFANELLDALPVHLVTMTRDGLREIYVDLQGDSLVERIGRVSTPAIAAYMAQVGAGLAVGARAEVNLSACDWVATAASRLSRGFLMLIDYGHQARDLYSPLRSGGTLATFSGHRTDTRDPASPHTPPWLVDPGSHDITSHVDFTGVGAAARRSGLDALGCASQTRVLMEIAASSGLLTELDQPNRLRDRLALKTLIVPAGLGSTHSILVFAKGVGHPDLMGFRALAGR